MHVTAAVKPVYLITAVTARLKDGRVGCKDNGSRLNVCQVDTIRLDAFHFAGSCCLLWDGGSERGGCVFFLRNLVWFRWGGGASCKVAQLSVSRNSQNNFIHLDCCFQATAELVARDMKCSGAHEQRRLLSREKRWKTKRLLLVRVTDETQRYLALLVFFRSLSPWKSIWFSSSSRTLVDMFRVQMLCFRAIRSHMLADNADCPCSSNSWGRPA